MRLVHNTHGVLDVNQYCDSGPRLGVELADLTNMLEYVATQVLFDEQQQDVALRCQRQTKERLALLDAFGKSLFCAADLAARWRSTASWP